MGKIVAFGTPDTFDGGTVHVWPRDGGGFEIAHESSSGNSWGYFAQFDCPQDATAAAYALNRDVLDNSCAVYLSPAVLAALPVTPTTDRREF